MSNIVAVKVFLAALLFLGSAAQHAAFRPTRIESTPVNVAQRDGFGVLVADKKDGEGGDKKKDKGEEKEEELFRASGERADPRAIEHLVRYAALR